MSIIRLFLSAVDVTYSARSMSRPALHLVYALGAVALAAAAPPRRVALRVDVVQVSGEPRQSGQAAPVAALRELLRRSQKTTLSTRGYDLAVGETARFDLPNGAKAAITPMALEPDGDVRLRIEVVGEGAYQVELSVPSGTSFQVAAGRCPAGHLLLTIRPMTS